MRAVERSSRMDILDDENLLVLAERPGDAVRHWGELIARSCGHGRPPFVVVLTDGNADGADADRQVRADLRACGLDGGRLLMFGIAGELPNAGAVFQAAVGALCFVGWRYDCNVLCAPPATLAIARGAATAGGLGLVGTQDGRYQLIAAPRRSASG